MLRPVGYKQKKQDRLTRNSCLNTFLVTYKKRTTYSTIKS